MTLDEATGRLRLGPGLVGLVAAGRRVLPGVAGPALERLSSELNETVALSVRDGLDVLCIAQHQAPRRALVVVTAETAPDETLEALRRYVALSTGGDLAIFTVGGHADVVGSAAAQPDLLAAARRLATAPAGVLLSAT